MRQRASFDADPRDATHYITLSPNCMFLYNKRPIRSLALVRVRSLSRALHNINDPLVIAEAFNHYFVNVGPSLANAIPATDTDPLSFTATSENSFFAAPTCADEVRSIALSLRNSAAGPDGINTALLKENLAFFIDPLVHAFNLSLQQGTFPCELKAAKVIPLFKSGNQRLVQNYRPISLLPSLSIILERLMGNRLTAFLESSNAFYKLQFGFRRSHSTNLALHYLVDKITDALDNGKVLLGSALDFRKAFDHTVDFTILLRKLEKIGIRGNNLDWFKSYLMGRVQCVFIEEKSSERLTTKCG